MLLEEDYYEEQDFSGLCIEEEELARKKFVRCNFHSADFTEVSMLYNCTFDACTFASAKLNGVTLRNCAFLSCKFQYASFFATCFEDCKMTGSDFLNADCSMIRIDGGDFSYTNLRMQQFSKQEMCGIRFWGADLSGCKFNQCKMNDCAFDEAIVHDTSFYGCDIRNSSIGGLDITQVNLKNAKLDEPQCVSIAEYLTEGKYVPQEAPK